jgi:amino acid adenylation domain-containing protein
MMIPATPSTNGPTPETLLQLIRQARLRIEELEGHDRTPLAVIGLGCRFPGAASPTAFWQNLLAGHDAIDEVPVDRWDANALYSPTPTPGKMNTRWGGFLPHIDAFDAHFFGISGVEAAAMDPQQRLLLEVAWETLEDAAIDPQSLAGSQTGVFIGISSNDYGRLQRGSAQAISAYAGVGNALSIAANRLSYLLDLHGPSLAIDTACSSALVAVHQACQSLRRGECEQALVGGVNVILSPAITVAFAQAGMMAGDGRCKTFDARADGYVRSEGAGMILLKRLPDAIRAGDPIWAVLAGTAINQDGRSNGLTAPNGLAQQAVIRQALHNAGVTPAQISYIETHGTGTALGDPIEVNALKALLSEGRHNEQPCWLGAVKANIGHLEAAAGIAGLIKTVLCLYHQQIPRQLHLTALNPHIDLTGSPFAIPQQTQPWPTGAEPRFAGVSAFGFGGANAHVIVTEAPQLDLPVYRSARSHGLFTLAAKDHAALRTLAERYAATLAADPRLPLEALTVSANRGRAHFPQRLALVVKENRQLYDALTAFATGESTDEIVASPETPTRPRLAFLFTGQGVQLLNAGRQLYATETVFHNTLHQCDAILQPLINCSLIPLLYPPDETDEERATARLADTIYAQPALFALEYALAQLWLAWGIKPDFVLGHSLGELVAACVAGAFTLEEGLWLATMRGRLMGSLPANGAMAAIFAPAATVTPYLAPWQTQVALAAMNGRAKSVIAGERSAVSALLTTLRKQGIESRLLPVGYAFHSPLMAPILDELEQAAANLTYHPLQLPLVSTCMGELLPVGYRFTAQDWRDQARAPVHFAQGIEQLLAQGCHLFVEIGPQPLLTTLGRADHPESDAQWLPSLVPAQDEWATIYRSLAQLYVQGATVAWSALYAGDAHQRLRLPTYPFQRQRYWFSEEDFMPHTHGHRSDLYTSRPQAQPLSPVMLGQEQNALLTELRITLAAILQLPTSALADDTPFVSLGADSILLLEANRRLEKRYGVTIPIRRFFEDLSTLTTLSHYIAQQRTPEKTPLPAQTQAFAEPQQAAIVQAISNGTDALPAGVTQQLLDIITKQLDLLTHHLLPPTTQAGQNYESRITNAESPITQHASRITHHASRITHHASHTLPLTEAQQQLWFLSQMSDAAAIAYNESVSLRLTGTLDQPALQRAVQALVHRHEALRTRISVTGDTQEVLPTLTMDLLMVDYSGTPDGAHSEQIATWLAEESRRTLDLTTGPLFRVALLKVAATEHLLVLTAHHIIIDGWSMQVLLHELSALYDAACADEVASLPPAPQFSDYIAWQQATKQSSGLAAEEAYWLEQLSGELPLLELPFDRPRPPQKSYQGALATVRLSTQTTQALQQLSRQQGCTLFMTLFTAYTILLHRLCDQEEVIVGVPVTGRTMPNGMGVVGYCTNLLPIRSRCNNFTASDKQQATGDGGTFQQFLQESRRRLLDAYANQEYPFARLISQLSVPRDLSLSPVVSSTFNLTQQPTLPSLTGLTVALGPRPTSFVDHDLSVNIVENNGELLVDFEYSSDLFTQSTAQRIADHFTTLLTGIIANGQQPVLTLPLLSAAERQQLLVTWNQTAYPFDPTQSFQQLFEAQVAHTPNAVAVRFGDVALTYTELNDQANCIAHRLRATGVGVDTVVAIWCERSPAFLAALLGIFKAGGAYLPLDVRAPAARQSQILAQSQTPLLLITADFATAADEAIAHLTTPPQVQPIEDLLAAGAPTTNLPLLPAATDPGARLAYVIYTSGSTGLPKGAMIEHRGMINHIYAKIKELHLTAADIVAQTAPQSFDISVWQFLSTLVIGGQIHIFNDTIAADPVALLQQSSHHGITILEVVPSLLRAMVDELAQGLAPDLSALRYMIPTGEALPPNLARQWLRYCPQIPLVNAYGPTECSDDVTHHFVTEPPAESVVNMPIGRPILNMRMYILDRQRQPVPIGVAGELYVGGIGVGRGYLHDPERTAFAFMPDPFSADPHARLYKTGDKARYLSDGVIEYLGRLDYQVKIRGFRIELGEIEAVLEAHPAVRQAVVMDRLDANRSKYLVAYLTTEQGAAEPDLGDIRTFVKQRLPEYMVPALFMPLATMPLTSNGKVDRKALPLPADDDWHGTVAYAAPETPLQNTLVTIWAEVLKLPPSAIGIYHSFFDLGGHSLLAGQIAARVRAVAAVELPIRELMEQPTIAALATCIQSRSAVADLLGQPLAAPALVPSSHEVIEL